MAEATDQRRPNIPLVQKNRERLELISTGRHLDHGALICQGAVPIGAEQSGAVFFERQRPAPASRVEGCVASGPHERFASVSIDETQRATTCLDSAGWVHLAAGLPTRNVTNALERIRTEGTVRTFFESIESPILERSEVTVILPPYIETSLLVEDWEACGYVPGRLGEGARIGHVITVIDADCIMEQLGSSHPISAYGWGKTAYDTRSIADILVGQIESASHLLVTGRLGPSNSIHDLLAALNPTALRCNLETVSSNRLHEFLACSRQSAHGSPSKATASVVPPWLEMLQKDQEAPSSNDRYLYRRPLPFDRERLGKWLTDPPAEVIRGKGKIWLANENVRAIGYSCAGSIHRIFAADYWWAGQPAGSWPQCQNQRRRLLDRWHPSFGDRRQEIAFVGVNLDSSEIRATLDACLLSEEAALESVSEFGPNHNTSACSTPEQEFH